MAAAKAVVFLFVFLSVCHCQDNSALLLKVIDAVEKLLSFYKANYQFLNLDGLYGLKVLEGQVQILLEEHTNGQHHHLSSQIVERLELIQQTAAHVSKLALVPVHQDDEVYFNDLSLLVKTPWRNFKHHRQIVPSKRWEIPIYHLAKNVRIEEGFSNVCMMEMTHPDANGGFKCALSQNCSDKMAKRGLTDYGITHQLLWTALAEKVGCEKEITVLLQKSGFSSVDEFQAEFCTNNFFEMLAVVHVYMKGKIHMNYQDLFLEQQFVCPNMGFYEFLKKDYLDQILKWQMPSGCFGDEIEPPNKVGAIPPELDLKKLFASQKPKGVAANIEEFQKQQRPVKPQGSKLKYNSERGLERGPLLKKLTDLKRQDGNTQDVENASISMLYEGQDRKNILGFQNKAVPLQQPAAAANPPKPDVENDHNDIKRFPAKRGAQEHMIVNKQEERVPMESIHKFRGENLGQEAALNAGGIAQKLQVRKMLSYHTPFGGRRRLLTEKDMPGGCLAHKSGVAAGALVMYLRYLIDPGPLDLVSPHDFFFDSHQNIPEGGEVYKTFMSKLEELLQQNQAGKDNNQIRQNAVIPGDQNVGDENGEEEENEEENMQDYDDNEEMYPDAGGGLGQQEKKRVVHFGANKGVLLKDNVANSYDIKDEEEYVDDNEDEEEEGPDYIKRVKGDDDDGGGDAAKMDEENQQEDDTEYTYYDDNDNADQEIIKKHRPQPQPEHGARIRTHNRHRSSSINSSNSDFLGQPDSPPTKTVILLLSASSVLLIIFIYRFIKKRRIHIRYSSRAHSRGFFRL